MAKTKFSSVTGSGSEGSRYENRYAPAAHRALASGSALFAIQRTVDFSKSLRPH
jgi:hypothetical protein